MKKNTGYTLIELMTMLAVVAIVLSVGVPQLNVYFQGNRMVTNTNDLLTALHLARSEAIKRGMRATVCKSGNAETSTPSCDKTANWEDGWLVFSDGNGTIGSYDPPGDVLLRIHPAAEGSDVTITPQGTGIADYVSFTSRGIPKDSGGSSQSGTFSICDVRGLKNPAGNVIARGVDLNAAGRVRSTKDEAKIVSCP